MLDFGFYNMDCMEGMKEFPDKYFDLAIVDPPYGDGGGTWKNGTRFGQRFERYINPQAQQCRQVGNRSMEADGGVVHKEREEPGQRNSEKNCSVGCCARS